MMSGNTIRRTKIVCLAIFVLCFIAALCSCVGFRSPTGAAVNGFLTDVAYEREPDGTERFVSKTSEPAASALIGETGKTIRAGIDAQTLRVGLSAVRDIGLVRERSAGTALVKGTRDPNIIPADPNIIPADPNIPR